MSPGRWLFRGARGTQGVAVEIEGEPDESILTEAASQIVAVLAEDRIGR